MHANRPGILNSKFIKMSDLCKAKYGVFVVYRNVNAELDFAAFGGQRRYFYVPCSGLLKDMLGDVLVKVLC